MQPYKPFLVSFIVPVHNGNLTLRPCLEAILAQEMTGINFEVLVVDNNSKDESAKIATEMGVSVLKEPKQGPQHARNLGLKMARGRWVAFVDADTILEPDWLSTLLMKMLEEDCSGAQGFLKVMSSKENSLFGRFRFYQDQVGLSGLGCSRRYFPVLNTSACIYDRGKVGEFYFDEGLSRGEDIELSWRLFFHDEAKWLYTTATGAKCYFYPESVLAFCRRNFKIGQDFGGFAITYSQKFPNLWLSEISKTVNWIQLEMKRELVLRDVAGLSRVMAATSLFLGMFFHRRHDCQIPLLPEQAFRWIVYDHYWERVNLKDGSRQSARIKR